MKNSKARILVGGLVATIFFATGAAYLFEIPPFKGVGAIEAGDVCENLGPSNKVVPAIRQMAPLERTYSFVEQQNHGSVDFFYSGCSGRAENSEFLITRTEVSRLGNSTFESWRNGPASKMVEAEDPKNFDRFSTGSDTWGVVSKSKAAIVTPCFSRGHHGLTTIILLRSSAEPERTADRYREELIDVAISAAEFAHKAAGCTLPFNS